MDKELTEYISLCSALRELHTKFLARKQELRLLLGETAALKKKAFLALAKANRIIRHTTGNQRQAAGLTYQLGELKRRVHTINSELASPVLLKDTSEEGEILSKISQSANWQLDDWQSDSNQLDQKRAKLTILSLIDGIRKKLLQLDILEQRCKELISSIKKALEAFYHESRIIRRKLYPFGIFSHFHRFFRGLLGNTHFTFKDMEDIAALGNITGLVLKIADSPLV